MLKRNEIYKVTDGDKIYIVPCGKCPYLIDSQVCPFVRCIKSDGWKVTK